LDRHAAEDARRNTQDDWARDGAGTDYTDDADPNNDEPIGGAR
jgi:hypothetical protein